MVRIHRQPRPQIQVSKEHVKDVENRQTGYSKERCPAREAVCHKCKKRGHYEAVCRSAKVIRLVEGEEDDLFLGEISTKKKANPWMTDPCVDGVEMQFKIDTGADVTIIPETMYRKQLDSTPEFTRSKKVLFGPGQNHLNVQGQFTGTMVKGDKTTQTEIFVIRGARQALLGRPTIEALELISSVQSVEKGTMEAKCKFKFPKLFKGLGKLEGDFAISLKPDAKPHAEYTPRRIPLPLMEQVKSELKRMVSFLL